MRLARLLARVKEAMDSISYGKNGLNQLDPVGVDALHGELGLAASEFSFASTSRRRDTQALR